MSIFVWRYSFQISILNDKKPLKWNRILMEEKLDDISHWLENSQKYFAVIGITKRSFCRQWVDSSQTAAYSSV
jgi:hypothetical protein